MQRVKWLIRVRQAIISMFLASIAALMISTAPAYASEGDANAEGANGSAPIIETTTGEGTDGAAGAAGSIGNVADQAAGAQTLAPAAAPAAEPVATPAADGQLQSAAAPAAVAEETLVVDVDENTTEEVAAVGEEGAQEFVITDSGTYTLTGEGNTSIRVDGQGQEIAPTINLVNAVINAKGTGHSAISIINGAQAILNIFGNCEFTGDLDQAGIQVDAASSVFINGTSEPSKLTAVGNGKKDYDSTEKLAEIGTYYGAGIGGTKASPDSGTIIIDGNKKNLTVSASGGGLGASGIGSAYKGSASVITISVEKISETFSGLT